MISYNNNFLRDLVFGANDGIAISFVLLFGLRGVFNLQEDFLSGAILILIWGAVITSASIYFAGKSENKSHIRELDLIKDDKLIKIEIAQTQKFLTDLDLNKKLQKIAIEELEKERNDLINDPAFGKKFIYRSPLHMALTYLTGFVIAGLIPLISFIMCFNYGNTILYPMAISALFLFCLSYIKGWFTGISKIFTAFLYVVIALFAGSVLYFITCTFS